MITDSIFYQIFQTLPNVFFELINQPALEVTAYKFQSVEIKQTAKRIDGVFIPNVDNYLMYFVEVQFQPDPDFYYRLFTEIFLYLGQNKPKRAWRAVAIFPRRSIDSEVPIEYQGVLGGNQIQWVYLDELGEAANQSIGLGIVQLVIDNQKIAENKAKQLIQKAQQIEDEAVKQKFLELIETILVYKFTQLSRQEIEAMFGLSDLKKTRVYQEAKQEGKQEGKLEGIPRLLKLGLSVEQIAEALELDIEVVKKAAQQ